MKRRVVKKVERRMLADKLCDLQQEIDEHLRFEGDLMVMIVRRDPDMTVLAHGRDDDYMSFIWQEVSKLLRENMQLAQNLKEK